MLIFPAIDLIKGQVVRLYQGDYEKAQVFGNDPLQYALDFEKAGAAHLHLVDLEGAKQGEPQNFSVVREIAEKTGLFLEFGGGVRDENTIERCLDAGVKRVILGTAALRNPDFVKRMAAKYGQSIAVGVDARDGRVAVEGWLETSEEDSISFCEKMRDIGIAYIIYTDISRDGAGQGTNLDVYRRLAEIKGLRITASGGVTSLREVQELRDMGLYAAVLGKALYTGKLDLAAAIQAAGEQRAEEKNI